MKSLRCSRFSLALATLLFSSFVQLVDRSLHMNLTSTERGFLENLANKFQRLLSREKRASIDYIRAYI